MSSKLELFQLCLFLIYLCISSILKEKNFNFASSQPVKIHKGEFLLEMTTALDVQ